MTSEVLRVLILSHSHPRYEPGEAQTFALETYHALQARPDVAPMFLSQTPHAKHPGTPFGTACEDVNQVLVHIGDYDSFRHTAQHRTVYTFWLRQFLERHRPDVVHLHHTLYIGFPLIRIIRQVLPRAAIVYTLQDMLPICHRDGLMIKTIGDESCTGASPESCHGCFPEIGPHLFFLRERYIKSFLALVDCFVCPSQFLLQRYASWGLPREKLRFMGYGRPLDAPAAARAKGEDAPRNRFGFMARGPAHKGLEVVLRAARHLTSNGFADFCVLARVGDLSGHSEEQRRDIARLVDECAETVTLRGGCEIDDVRALWRDVDWLVVASVSWDYSPLVIKEAFMQRKPVICSDIAVNAEEVTHGVNGLHFRAGDAQDLARTMRQAVEDRDVWERLREGTPTVASVNDVVESYLRLYRSILKGRDGEPRRN